MALPAAEESSLFVRPSFARNVAAVVGAAVLIACANGAGARGADGVFFPTLPHMNGWPAALLQGTLLERNGCVVLAGRSESVLLLWPEGYSTRRDPDGSLVVLDDHGDRVGRMGDEVSLGGGLVGESRQHVEFAEKLIGQKIPGRCYADAYAVTSGPA
jgi:hypothetical protein